MAKLFRVADIHLREHMSPAIFQYRVNLCTKSYTFKQVRALLTNLNIVDYVYADNYFSHTAGYSFRCWKLYFCNQEDAILFKITYA